MKRIKELYSHIDPGADWVKVIELMSKDVLKKRDPLAVRPKRRSKATAVETPKPTPNEPPSAQCFFAAKETAKKPRQRRRTPIPAKIRREIYQRDQGKCQFKGVDGRICGNRFLPEVDHRKPVCRGGSNDIENLQMLCRQHNQYRYRSALN